MSGDFCVSSVGAANGYGQSDPFVRDAQQWLNDAGAVPPLQTDGIWGPKTRAALKEFQREHRLPVTGTLDPATVDALENAAKRIDVDPFAPPEPKSTPTTQNPLDLAKLAAAAYPDHPTPEGWTELTDADLRRLGLSHEMFVDARSGFHATLFRSDSGDYVLAYRGSDQARDWIANIQQGAGAPSRQYVLGVSLATNVKEALRTREPDAQLTFVGHSLGGGLASKAAIATQTAAVTFNAAGLSFGETEDALRQAYMSFEQLVPEEDLVTSFQVDSDVLSVAQQVSIVGDAAGKHIVIDHDAMGSPATGADHRVQIVIEDLQRELLLQ